MSAITSVSTKHIKKKNEVTWEAGEYLGWYIEKLAKELTYHHLHFILGRKGYESDSYLTAHPKPINTYISPLTLSESTSDGDENLKSVARRVGQFNTHATGNK